MNTRRSPVAPVAAAAVLLASACGGTDSSSPGDSDELTPITVGVMPIVDTAAIFLGDEQGIFAEHGLELTFEMAQGGAAIIPAVVGDSYEFGFSNVPSLLVGASQDLPLRLVAPANTTTGDTAEDFSAVLVAEDSEIAAPEDLSGHTVAVSTLNNIGDVTISQVVEDAGGDASSIEFVEMPFPDMPAALSRDQVDAIWVLEPYLTMAQEDGAQVVTHNYAETDPELLIAAYFTTATYAEQNPEVVEAFTAAMDEAQAYAHDNPEEVREVLGEYTEITPEVREQLVMPEFPTELDPDAVQLQADLALEHGLVSEPVDIETLLP